MSSSSFTFFKNLIDNYQLDSYLNTNVINNITLFIDNMYSKEEFTAGNTSSVSYSNQKNFYNKRKKFSFYYKNKFDKIEKNTDTVFEKVNITYSTNNIDKINFLIRSNLNKITNDNYELIIKDLINDIIDFNSNYNSNGDIDVFNILSSELINKSIIDQKYQYLYIDIILNLNMNNNFISNILIIKNNNNKYYYKFLDNDVGPFNKKNDCYTESMKNNIFLKYILKNLNQIYLNKDIYIDDQCNDNKKKKYLFNFYELLSKMFIKKIINIKILNILFIKLLHCDNNFNMISSTEIELSYILFNNIFTFFEKSNKLSLIAEMFREKFYSDIINIFNQLFENQEIIQNKRNLFFIKNIIQIINNIRSHEPSNKNNTKTISYKNIIKINIDEIKKNINNYIKLNDREKMSLIFEKMNKLDNKEQNEIVNYIINLLLDFKQIDNFHIDIYHLTLKKYNKCTIETLESIYSNLEDILLDSPYLLKNLVYIINSQDNTTNQEFNNIYSKFIKYNEEMEDETVEEEISFR